MLGSKKEKFDRTSGEPVVEESKDDEEWDVLDTNNSVLKENSSILFDIEEDKDEEGRPVGRSSTIYSRDKSFTVTLEDFKLLKRIGEGAFGKVYLVTHEGTDKVYAMKSIRKDKIIDYEQLESTKLEKTILLSSNHPFIVQMEYVFQNDVRLYFLMEYVKGGELFTHIIEKKRFDEVSTKFIAAQIACALGYLHSKEIIYRDLKPENVLIAQDGYIKLIDFGLSRILHVDDVALTFGGTPEYCSPEMINEVGHDCNTDWWALGVIIYEMLIGIPPFYDKNRVKMFIKIKKKQPKYPDINIHKFGISDVAKDLIQRLLEKDKDRRLGFKNDVTEVLAHEFFDGIDIDELMDKIIVPPFIPVFKQKEGIDVSNFDAEYTNLDAKESIIDNDMKDRIVAKAKAYMADFDQIVNY